MLTSLFVQLQYGKDYEYEAPVKLLDKLLHEMPQSLDEQIVVVSQVLLLYLLNSELFNYFMEKACSSCGIFLIVKVLVADINIGYEEIVNTQVQMIDMSNFLYS